MCLYLWAEWALQNNRCVWWDAQLTRVEDEPPEPPGDLGARVAELERIVASLGRLPVTVGDGQWTLATWE